MGTGSISKTIILIFMLLLLSASVFAQAVPVSSDTAIMQQLTQMLQKNKDEIIKTMRDTQAQNQNLTSKSIDENFGMLDTRIQGFLKDSKRDFAIIIVGGLLVAFALSQIIKMAIEKSRRRSLIKRAMDLDIAVVALEKEAGEMMMKVRQLKALDERYSADLKGYAHKEPFISLKLVVFGIITLCVGIILTYFLGGHR